MWFTGAAGAGGARDPAGHESFTTASPGSYSGVSGRSHTRPMETTGRLLFIAAVTCYLLGRIFADPASTIELVVYSATAAFGLEFLMVSWRDLWQHG
jgi:hypothetical protein